MRELLAPAFELLAAVCALAAAVVFFYGRRGAEGAASIPATTPRTDALTAENERLRGELIRASHELAVSRRLASKLSRALQERGVVSAAMPPRGARFPAPEVHAHAPLGAAGPFAIRRGLA